jgi:hypothetical protein
MLPYLSHCQTTFGLGFALVHSAGWSVELHSLLQVCRTLFIMYRPKIPMKSNMQMYGC